MKMPTKQLLPALLILLAVAGAIGLAVAPLRVMAVGVSGLALVAMPMAALQGVTLAFRSWRLGRRGQAVALGVMALLFALLAVGAVWELRRVLG